MAKYSKGAQKGVESAMKRMEKGKLRSGRSGKKVSNPKQAIAIGLSEARKKGAKVPKKKTAVKKSAAKKTTVKKSAAKKTAVKKSAAKKSAVAKKRTAPKKKVRSRKASPKKGAAKKKTVKKAVKKTARKAAPKKRASADTVPVNESANLRSATAENETPVATNHVQTEMLQSEDPMRKVDQHAFDKFTSKGDPRQKLRLSSKPKSGVKPSGKKPLWN